MWGIRMNFRRILEKSNEKNIIQMAIQRVNKGHKVRLLKWD